MQFHNVNKFKQAMDTEDQDISCPTDFIVD